MHRDTIFHKLFQQSPTLIFDFIRSPPEDAARYQFKSVEVKETAFRIDGVFEPPNPQGIVYFCEVQFQLDETLYERMVSEIALYSYRYRADFFDWRAVVIYPSRSMEQAKQEIVSEYLVSGRITRVYLDELVGAENLAMGLDLMLLTTLVGDEMVSRARELIQKAGSQADAYAIIDLVSTIVVYRFTALTRDEVRSMLGIDSVTLQQTRFYQDVLQEGEERGEERGVKIGEKIGEEKGKIEGERSLILKQLTRKLKKVPIKLQKRVNSLEIDRLESLGEALLDFNNVADLERFLDS
jgi:predicted transposase/invertase (TIGR01784 family)